MSWDLEHRWTASVAPDGRNMGWESPVATRILAAKKEAWNDVELREELTKEWLDHQYEQHMRIGILEAPGGNMYNSDIIAGFSSRVPGLPWLIWDQAYVTLRK
jgi:hypothetical protein